MALRFAREHPGLSAVITLVGILHLFLLCAPIAWIAGGVRYLRSEEIIAFLVMASVWYFVESFGSAAQPRSRARSRGSKYSMPVVGPLVLVVFWISLIDSVSSVSPAPASAVVAGVVMMGVGMGLRYLAIRELGKFFLDEVAMVPGQPLVVRGIYGVLRHPSEAGTLWLVFGGAVMLDSLYGVAAGALLVLPCVCWRTRLEDRMFRDHFGTEFSRYVGEVPAFIPRKVRPFFSRGSQDAPTGD